MRILLVPFRYISALSWCREKRGSPPKPCHRLQNWGSSENAIWLYQLTSNGSSLTDLTRDRASARAYSELAHILPFQLGVTIAAGEKCRTRLQGCTPLKLSAGREVDDLRRTEPDLGGRNNRGVADVLLRIYYALVFLFVGLVAGALGLVGVVSMASQIAWILLLIGVLLLVVQLLRRRTPPVA
jgi:uncharacterized membrane protein YtjA (UPF0391 family)